MVLLTSPLRPCHILLLVVFVMYIMSCSSSTFVRAGSCRIYTESSDYFAWYGGSLTNYVWDDYHSASSSNGATTYNTVGNGFAAEITTSADFLTAIETGRGPIEQREQYLRPSTHAGGLFYSFTSSSRPVYAFGGSVLLADVDAQIVDGVINVLVGGDNAVQLTLTSDVDFDLRGLWRGFVCNFPIYFVAFRPAAPVSNVYVSSTIFTFGETPMIINDPHFTGFQGERYEFQGENNKWFNILSDKRLQVNALFQHLSYNNEGSTNMVAFGILINDHTVLVHANTSDVMVDGKLVSAGHRNDIQPSSHIIVSKNDVEISTPHYTFIIEHKQTHHKEAFLNMFPAVKDTSRSPHGVLGQTLHHRHLDKDNNVIHVHTGNKEGKGEIEGTYEDYEVSSAFAIDSKFNRYEII